MARRQSTFISGFLWTLGRDFANLVFKWILIPGITAAIVIAFLMVVGILPLL